MTSHPSARLRAIFVVIAAVALAFSTGWAGAQQKKPESSARGETPKAHESRMAPPNDASKYCTEIAASASAARNARAEKELTELERRIIVRTAELDAKRAELQAVLDRHEAMVKKADERLVAIYARMRPDAAAAQFADMDEEMAAAMLMRLEPKKSSAILNEMEAPRAVALTRKVAGLTTLPQTGTKQ